MGGEETWAHRKITAMPTSQRELLLLKIKPSEMTHAFYVCCGKYINTTMPRWAHCCGTEVSDQSSMVVRKKLIEDEIRFCPKCGERNDHIRDAICHWLADHDWIPAHICVECSGIYFSNIGFKYHQIGKHGSIKITKEEDIEF